MVEQTIVSYQPGGNLNPLIKKEDGKKYPKNPEDECMSQWPATFLGCLGCGEVGNMFNTCP